MKAISYPNKRREKEMKGKTICGTMGLLILSALLIPSTGYASPYCEGKRVRTPDGA
jgi:hypothetical protein